MFSGFFPLLYVHFLYRFRCHLKNPVVNLRSASHMIWSDLNNLVLFIEFVKLFSTKIIENCFVSKNFVIYEEKCFDRKFEIF